MYEITIKSTTAEELKMGITDLAKVLNKVIPDTSVNPLPTFEIGQPPFQAQPANPAAYQAMQPVAPVIPPQQPQAPAYIPQPAPPQTMMPGAPGSCRSADNRH